MGFKKVQLLPQGHPASQTELGLKSSLSDSSLGYFPHAVTSQKASKHTSSRYANSHEVMGKNENANVIHKIMTPKNVHILILTTCVCFLTRQKELCRCN